MCTILPNNVQFLHRWQNICGGKTQNFGFVSLVAFLWVTTGPRSYFHFSVISKTRKDLVLFRKKRLIRLKKLFLINRTCKTHPYPLLST